MAYPNDPLHRVVQVDYTTARVALAIINTVLPVVQQQGDREILLCAQEVRARLHDALQVVTPLADTRGALDSTEDGWVDVRDQRPDPAEQHHTADDLDLRVAVRSWLTDQYRITGKE